MATRAINDSDFETSVLKSSTPVLVDFWAEWCGPCRGLAPKLEEIAGEMNGKVEIVKINVDENPKTPEKFGIRSIPTMILFKDGKQVEQLLGNLPKADIVAMLQRHSSN